MGNQAGIIIRNVNNELFHSAKRLILNEVKGIECLLKEAKRQRLTLQQQQYVSKSLKRAFAELEEARTANMELPDATDLFKILL